MDFGFRSGFHLGANLTNLGMVFGVLILGPKKVDFLMSFWKGPAAGAGSPEDRQARKKLK